MFDKKKWEALQEAIKGNGASQVTAVAAKLTLAREEGYYEACVTAIEHGASDALAALLVAGGGFNFSKRILSGNYYNSAKRERAENENMARTLVEKAFASPAAETLLPVLYQNRQNGNLEGYISLDAFLNEKSPEALLETCLKGRTLANPLNECIVRTGSHSTDKLKFILKFADAKKDAETLANALWTVAAQGDIDKATLLLETGANPNLNGDQAIISAAAGGQKTVDLILPRIALKYLSNNIVMLLHQRNTDLGIIAGIEAAIQKATQTAITEPAAAGVTHAATQGDRFHRLDADTLEEVKKLSNGSTLTTLFNFSTRQQKDYMTNEAGKTSHGEPVNFSDLDEGVIEAMRAKLDALAEPTSPPPAAANDGYRKFRSAI